MKSILLTILHHKITRFVFVGGLATLTHIGVAFSAIYFSAIPVFIANIFGFSVAFGLSYLMQSLFVFRKSLTRKNAFRFFIVQFSALLISQIISGLFDTTNNYIQTLLIVFMLPVITYLIHNLWTYKQGPSAHS